jgi:putative ABC transport system ATP-binding protein
MTERNDAGAPGKNGGEMIRLSNIRKVYQTDRIETLALDNINLTIGSGELVSVMGPSGCGKSTLLNLIGLLDAPSGGDVVLGGETIDNWRDRRLARIRNEKIGFIFQSFHLIQDLSVRDNVELPLLYRKLGGRERRRLAQAAIERVGLSGRMHHYPSQLSGGQQQRVAIARAIVGRPALLLADEPTGNLDSHMGDEVMAVLENLNQESGTTVVMVTHDQRMADRTPRTIRLFDGRQVH